MDHDPANPELARWLGHATKAGIGRGPAGQALPGAKPALAFKLFSQFDI